MTSPTPQWTSALPDRVIPYITRDQYRAAPTAIDTSNLISGGTQADQDAELDRLIRQASAWCDTVAQQPLTAQAATETLRTRVTKDGKLRLHPRQWPILGVTNVGYGVDAGGLTYLQDLSGVWIEPQSIIVPLASALSAGWSGALQFGVPAPWTRLLVSLSYVAGWPVTTLTVASAAATSTLTVRDSTGIIPGQQLRVQSGSAGSPLVQSVVVVASVAGNTVTLTGPLGVDAPTGAAVTALPDDVEQAAVWATTGLLKQRGTGALVMQAGQSGTVAKGDPGAEEFDRASAVLAAYRPVAP